MKRFGGFKVAKVLRELQRGKRLVRVQDHNHDKINLKRSQSHV